MACFLVPAAEAVVMTAARRIAASKETETQELSFVNAQGEVETGHRVSFSRKLKWLTNMLWGGSALLMFEHVWHGEVTPWMPFLTGARSAADAMEMVHEMTTTGVGMAILVTAVWGGVVAASHFMEKFAQKEAKEAAE